MLYRHAIHITDDWRWVVGMRSPSHQPVMVEGVVQFLGRPEYRWIVDGTIGAGGHAEALLQATPPSTHLIGIDRDPSVFQVASEHLHRYEGRFSLYHGDYKDLEWILEHAGIERADAILLDLGLSSMQLEEPSRGFSFQSEGPLDMRFDPQSLTTAADIVATWGEEELAALFWEYGEEPNARRIARAIVRKREGGEPLQTTTELSRLIEATTPFRGRRRIHPATRVFQALRIAVNEELSGLQEFLDRALDFLAPGGRLGIVSYHSLEDRLVKQAFQRWQRECLCPPGLPECVCGKKREAEILTRGALRPSPLEVAANSRSRSARFRVVEKIKDSRRRRWREE